LQPQRTFLLLAVFTSGASKKGALMTKSIPVIALLGGSLLLLGACAPPPPPPCDACAAMARANAAYDLAAKAEADAQTAISQSSTMYQRSLHK
jgi:hypothetical protein